MKIVLTGGGTGGHFYPLIAVAQELNRIIEEKSLARARLYYFSDTPYDEAALFEQRIGFVAIPAGKMRLYASVQNFFDIFKVVRGVFVALWRLYRVYPDVVFAKGGYASFPTLVAARLLHIPIVIHESDTVPGRVNKIAGRWASRIAVSYAEAGRFFPKDRVAHTGQPVRRELTHPIRDGAYEYLKLEPGIPVIFIVGGSQGAKILNETVLACIAQLVPNYQIIHQVGQKNTKEIEQVTTSLLLDNPYKARYRVYGFLNPLASAMVAGVADLVITRAGSQLFEIAGWKIPAIVVPITHSNGDHQRENAFAYARCGAGVVIEERNLTPHVLMSEARRILQNTDIQKSMKQGAETFHYPDAAKVIAEELVAIAESHEK